jgi:hypothetical protein
MEDTRSRGTGLIIAVAFAALAIGAAAGWFARSSHTSNIELGTTYQTVVLENGQVYFGKLERAGADFPVLHDVFYIQSRTNPETKETTNILIKRGKEWHAPDRMILNGSHILFIEPVTADSKVAKLIAEAK